MFLKGLIMAYWQVRDGFNHQDIENIDKIEVDDLLFLTTEGIIVSYARCVKNNSNGIEVDNWENISLEPAFLPNSLERGIYQQKIALIKNNNKIYELLSLLKSLKIYKIRTLKITNFRLFKNVEINFNKNINVIIANNGAGKTTLLDAIALGFGSMLTHLPNISGIGFSNDKRDLRINSNNKKEPYLRIELTSTQNLKWDRIDKRDKSKTTAKKIPNGYGLKELETFMDTIIDSENEGKEYIMPLIIYYGTCRNCFDVPLRKINFQREFNRFEALSSSLKGDSNFSRLFQWFDAMENLERIERLKTQENFNFELPELKNVRKAITSMLKGFQNPRIKNRPLRFMIDRVEDDGSITQLQIEQLSAGYKAVLAMVMDISARMSEANPHLGNKSKAIILIDELDLHLHPKWQQTILSDLRQTFPNAQFIVTTHSPQILTTVKKEQVFILEDNQIKKPFDTVYAKRSIVALEDLMGTDSMPPLEEVDLLDKYLDKIHQGEVDSKEVLELRDKLNNLYGNDYQQLRIADMIINKYKALKNN